MKKDEEMQELWKRYEELQKEIIERFEKFLAVSDLKLKPGRLERFAFDWAVGTGMSEGQARTFGFYMQNIRREKKVA